MPKQTAPEEITVDEWRVRVLYALDRQAELLKRINTILQLLGLLAIIAIVAAVVL